MTVSGLDTFSWGSREYTGKQVHKIMADWHKLRTGNKCLVMEMGDICHSSQGDFLGDAASKLWYERWEGFDRRIGGRGRERSGEVAREGGGRERGWGRRETRREGVGRERAFCEKGMQEPRSCVLAPKKARMTRKVVWGGDQPGHVGQCQWSTRIRNLGFILSPVKSSQRILLCLLC